jgi:hypothetical protein
MKKKNKIIWKCNNTKEIDQIMVEKLSLWIIFYLWNSHLTFFISYNQSLAKLNKDL